MVYKYDYGCMLHYFVLPIDAPVCLYFNTVYQHRHRLFYLKATLTYMLVCVYFKMNCNET